ncbi:hypothetical protein [Pseudaquidulcibacter saccharophilus]|uniref:hypothetical protein n=1 Tax=Pseudaquidulcibacter saccharophilus TaxID=2831900 RepID=UPI001EFF3066|nr:hypothetical protein [Pseudaquidulcibacter saccharophilus]
MKDNHPAFWLSSSTDTQIVTVLIVTYIVMVLAYAANGAKTVVVKIVDNTMIF